MRVPPTCVAFVFIASCPNIDAQSQHVLTWNSSRQNFSVERLTANDGLSSNSIWSIVQDREGFMWFGTPDGLNRYDGYAVTVYRSDLRDSTSLPINGISIIRESRNGKYLWLATYGAGFAWFDKKTGRCKPYQRRFRDRIFAGIQDIVEDTDSTLWLATNGAVFSLRFSLDSILSLREYVAETPDSFRIGSNNFTTVYRDDSGKLWFGTPHGLYFFDRQRDKLMHSKFTPNVDSIVTISEDGASNLWLGTMFRGVYRVDADRTTATHIADSGLVNASLAVDSVSVWFGTESAGVLRVDTRTNTISAVSFGRLMPAKLRILSLCKDSTGMLWIGTQDDGIIKLAPAPPRFTTYRTVTDKHPEANSVWSLCEARDGTIWVGTSNGVKALDRSSSQLIDKPFPRMMNYQVRAILEDGDAMWFGTLMNGLWKWEHGKNRWKHFVHNPKDTNSIHSNNVYTLHEDRSGILWIGTNAGGLTRLDPTTETFKNCKQKNNWVTTIHEDRDGTFWLGTWAFGLCRFDRAAETYEYFPLIATHPKEIAANTVLAIHESRATPGVLWLGTHGSGVIRFETKTKQMTTYTTRNGLPNNFVYGILEDTLGSLWFSTNAGIAQFNPSLHAFKNYTASDGLQSDQFNLGASFVSSKGEFFFGGRFGLDGFIPSTVINPFPPQVSFTKITASGLPIQFEEELAEQRALTLAYDARDITFEFVGRHYADASKNKYAYRMIGLDSNWIELKSERKVVFPQLLPGDYAFSVKAANSDGVWSEPIQMHVRIAHPYWTTWWFYVLIAAFGGTAALLFFGFSRRLARKVKIKMREEFGENVHDGINPHLSILSGEATKLEELLKDASPEARSRARKLVDNLHIASKEIDHLVGQFSPGKESLYELAVSLKDFSDHLFDDANVAFELKGVSKDFEDVTLPLEWRLNIHRIFKEAMHNVLKHAKETSRVSLSFALTDRRLCVELADNGKGFDEDALERVNGLRHMRARACELGGKLEIATGNGCGTKVRFTAKLP